MVDFESSGDGSAVIDEFLAGFEAFVHDAVGDDFFCEAHGFGGIDARGEEGGHEVGDLSEDGLFEDG